jgi:hypothetical protein
MKPIPQDIIGKRLETVLIRESGDGRPPQAQLFLCFDDGTSAEFWADGDIHPAGGLDKDTAEDIERKARPGTTTRARTKPAEGENNETIRLSAALGRIQDLIIQVLESLSEDYTGEARHGIAAVERAASNSGLPDSIRLPLLDACERAWSAISGLERDKGRCARILQEERRRVVDVTESVSKD